MNSEILSKVQQLKDDLAYFARNYLVIKSKTQGKIKLDSTAILCGFGAGMTWGAAVVRLRKGIC